MKRLAMVLDVLIALTKISGCVFILFTTANDITVSHPYPAMSSFTENADDTGVVSSETPITDSYNYATRFSLINPIYL